MLRYRVAGNILFGLEDGNNAFVVSVRDIKRLATIVAGNLLFKVTPRAKMYSCVMMYASRP